MKLDSVVFNHLSSRIRLYSHLNRVKFSCNLSYTLLNSAEFSRICKGHVETGNSHINANEMMELTESFGSFYLQASLSVSIFESFLLIGSVGMRPRSALKAEFTE